MISAISQSTPCDDRRHVPDKLGIFDYDEGLAADSLMKNSHQPRHFGIRAPGSASQMHQSAARQDDYKRRVSNVVLISDTNLAIKMLQSLCRFVDICIGFGPEMICFTQHDQRRDDLSIHLITIDQLGL